jgi:hypothetical protein
MTLFRHPACDDIRACNENQCFGAARLQDHSRGCSHMPKIDALAESLYRVKSWAARLSRWRPRSMDNRDP